MSDAGSRPGAALVIQSGNFEGSRYELEREETIIGRNPGTEITLLDESISREHAIVSWDEPNATWSIEDLQSTNGTKVNGKRVRTATLTDGDDVQVGQTRFKFILNTSE